MPQSVPFRNALWAILDNLDSDEARREQSSDSARLLETIRLYALVPKKIILLVQSMCENDVEVSGSLCASRANDAIADLNSWLAKLGLPTVDKLPPPPAPPKDPEPPPVILKTFPAIPPLPQTWPDFVLGVRERLQSDQGPLPPFSRWVLPQLRWSSRWIDAFAVIAADEQDSNSGFVLVPSEDAATSIEAEQCWRKRIQTAQSLQSRTVSSQVARVFLHTETESVCSIALLRSESTKRTLADSVRPGECLSPRKCLDLGISLCGILGALNAHGINVLDLSPSWIAFDWSAGQRFTQLLDPTAVIPGRGLLPEWRGVELGLADAAKLAHPELSQVFLIGALVLALMCGTIEEFLSAQFPDGRSATLASLSGSQQLADRHSDSIATPLVVDLARKAAHSHETLDTQAVVEVLRWSVAERLDHRFDTLLRFAAELRQAMG